MSNYYDMQKGKVKIAEALMERGWKVYGYHEDQSDSMTDYWCPAYWDGIAEKNGYILVVDHNTEGKEREITKYNPAGNLSFEDREKITKLEAITTERGATEGEEENAKALIEKIQSKTMDQPAYEIIGTIPGYMANPGKCKWHIEKDGKLYDKGTGITKYSKIPDSYEFDIIKMEYTDRYKKVKEWNNNINEWEWVERKLNPKTEKVIKDFKALILRFERVVNGMNTMGDGTKETEQKTAEQQIKEGYKKVTITETKTSLKMVEVTDRKEIKIGDYLTFKYHGGFWKVTSSHMQKGTWKINGVPTKMEKLAFTYNIVGKASRGYKDLKNPKGYYQYEDKLLKEIESGDTKIYELKEVTEEVEIEKWVKIDKTQKSKNTYNSKQEKVQEEKQTTTGETIEQNETTNPYEPQEIKDGFIYDCHFKEWDIPMEEIKEAVTALNISFIDLGAKIGFGGVTAEQARQLKEISDINGSIFFIDAEKAITADNSTTKKQPESEEVTAQQETETNNTINFEEYKNNSEVEEMKTNNNSNDFNFDDIMNQFDNIEINNNSRISADDEEFCKKEQEQYTKAVNVLNRIKEVIQQDLNIDITADRPHSTQKSNNKYLGYYEFDEITKLFYSKKDSFIHNIITYFTNKYKITIDSYKVCDKYKKVDVDYNILLDEIFLQLGGFSFNEKALTEIKDALHKKVYNSYQNKFDIEIKGNKIIFNSTCIHWVETTKYEYIAGKRINTPIVESGSRSGEIFKPYIDAFSWFEYGKVLDIKPELRYYQISITPEEFKNGVMIGNKVEKIKFFKNGRMDVTFKSSQHARQFAKEYCKYIEKAS